MPPARQSVAQRNRSAVSSGISKACRWKISRKVRRPRGLENAGNTCYRNAVLQSLLHLPKFLNWVMQHNESRQNWPCRTAPADSNQAPPLKWADEPAIKALGEEGMGCVPCLLKDLIRNYWGNILLDEGTGNPLPLPYLHEGWHHLHQLSRRWFYRNPSDMEDILREPKGTIQERRAMEMDNQQDNDEFMRKLLDGIEYTYDHV
jgi:hypothetical protein